MSHPHALFFVTGWLYSHKDHFLIQGVPVQWHPELVALVGKRVTAKLRLVAATSRGRLLMTSHFRVSPARMRRRNSVSFQMLGKLHSFDPSSYSLTVRLSQHAHIREGKLVTARCTPRQFGEINKDARFVQVKGGLIEGWMVLDECVAVAAPTQTTPVSPAEETQA